jgi:cyclic-di-GMP-binding biofilm dispersal mediator protein
MSFQGQTIVVVGASGVLGSRIATELSSLGASVIGTASSESSVVNVPDQVSSKRVVDLTDSNSISNFANDVINSHSSVDGVIVAAGVVGFGLIEETDPVLASKMMEINFAGPAKLISKLFPALKNHSNEKAFVIGITGVVVEQTFPGMSIYSASKSALSSFLQSIEKEWRRYKIRTLDVRLGHTETGLATRPLFGAAPAIPTGHSAEHAVSVIINAINSETRILASTDF